MTRTLRSPPGTASIPPHRYRLFVINHIAQVCQRALELPAVDRLSGFAGVFEGDAEIGAVSAGGFALLDRGGCVADLDEEERVSRRVWNEVDGGRDAGLRTRFSVELGVQDHDRDSRLFEYSMRRGFNLPS